MVSGFHSDARDKLMSIMIIGVELNLKHGFLGLLVVYNRSYFQVYIMLHMLHSVLS